MNGLEELKRIRPVIKRYILEINQQEGACMSEYEDSDIGLYVEKRIKFLWRRRKA
jgi:hypothetical protein